MLTSLAPAGVAAGEEPAPHVQQSKPETAALHLYRTVMKHHAHLDKLLAPPSLSSAPNMEECDLLEFPAGQCCNSRKKLQAISGNLLDALPLLFMSQAKVLADDDEHPQLHKHE